MHNISLNQEIGAVFRTNNCVVSVVMNIIVVCCIHVAGAWMRIYCVHVIIMVFVVVVVYCNVSGPGWIECVYHRWWKSLFLIKILAAAVPPSERRLFLFLVDIHVTVYNKMLFWGDPDCLFFTHLTSGEAKSSVRLLRQPRGLNWEDIYSPFPWLLRTESSVDILGCLLKGRVACYQNCSFAVAGTAFFFSLLRFCRWHRYWEWIDSRESSDKLPSAWGWFGSSLHVPN